MGKASDTRWFRGAAPALAGLCALVAVSPGLAAPVPAASPPAAGLAEAARRNQDGLGSLPFVAFHGPQVGWEIYAPLIAHEIGAAPLPGAPAFARALAVWQGARALGRAGVMDEATFTAMNTLWLRRRPFVAASRSLCPSPAPDTALEMIPAAQSYGGKIMRLESATLAAYGRMLAAARAEAPDLRADPRLLTVFSAWRSPDADAARCALEANCQGVTRASCSAHATGQAIDLYLGAAPGHRPDSSDDVNRLFMSRGVAYRWLVENAGRFGFTPYAYEPWHWEWTGAPA